MVTLYTLPRHAAPTPKSHKPSQERQTRFLSGPEQAQTDGLQQMIWHQEEEFLIKTTGDTEIKIRSDLISADVNTTLSMERIPLDGMRTIESIGSLPALTVQIGSWLGTPLSAELPAALAEQAKGMPTELSCPKNNKI